MSETETALAVLPASAISTIIEADKNDLLGSLKAKLEAHKADISTPKGREKIASLAYQVATTKTSLVKLGKGLTEGWRKQTQAVNKECGIIEERLDALKEQVRAPLTEWENVEKARVAENEAAIKSMEVIVGMLDPEATPEDIQDSIYRLTARAERAWDLDFREKASGVFKTGIYLLEARLVAAKKRVEDRIERERLQAIAIEEARVEAERAKIEREARIAAEAADAARLEAEHKAEMARVAAERQAAVEIQRQKDQAASMEAAFKAKEEADKRVIAEAAAREKRLMDQIEADMRASKERDANAEQSRIAAQGLAESNIRKAIEIDRQRVAAADAERAANVIHRQKINTRVQQAMVAVLQAEGDPDAEILSTALVEAIGNGLIPHVTITY